MVVLSYILWTLSFAFKLSLIRGLEMLFFHPSGITWHEVLLTFYWGFRMDMMTVGFWFAPVIVYLIFSQLFTGRAIAQPLIVRFYLIFSWFFVCFLYLKDLIAYPLTKNRVWWPDLVRHPFLNLNQILHLEWWWSVIVVLATMGLFWAGIKRFPRFIKKFQRIPIWGLIVLFFWTALISRGTLTQQHLRRDDCQFSQNPKVEFLCLNPLFTFSKRR